MRGAGAEAVEGAVPGGSGLALGVLGPVESRALQLASIWRWEGTVRLGSRVNPRGADAEGTEDVSGSGGGRKEWGERGECRFRIPDRCAPVPHA
jgi:hypothetical protein